MSERTDISFDAALMMALRADAQRELDSLPTPKETEESYTVRCSIIQPGQQSLFDNEHTVYETVKVGEADGVLGTSTDEHGKNVYTLSWEHRGITHTVMGNIPYDEIMKIAEGIR